MSVTGYGSSVCQSASEPTWEAEGRMGGAVIDRNYQTGSATFLVPSSPYKNRTIEQASATHAHVTIIELNTSAALVEAGNEM
jgi:hypothetical protein